MLPGRRLDPEQLHEAHSGGIQHAPILVVVLTEGSHCQRNLQRHHGQQQVQGRHMVRVRALHIRLACAQVEADSGPVFEQVGGSHLQGLGAGGLDRVGAEVQQTSHRLPPELPLRPRQGVDQPGRGPQYSPHGVQLVNQGFLAHRLPARSTRGQVAAVGQRMLNQQVQQRPPGRLVERVGAGPCPDRFDHQVALACGRRLHRGLVHVTHLVQPL
mmetsp:Transcript_4299/g.10360  ORF Transcript_4299/g.10360 Transcript_4299/m.10360 type:complete len:214 (+) Transcript_4299:90-731(+)